MFESSFLRNLFRNTDIARIFLQNRVKLLTRKPTKTVNWGQRKYTGCGTPFVYGKIIHAGPACGTPFLCQRVTQ
jgi:hypothetical protein